MARKKKTDETVPQAKAGPLRDDRGRLLPGQSLNPSGLSKSSAEFKAMCEHVLLNGAWDVWWARLQDPSTPATTIHAMTEFLSNQVYGKPGIRKEEQGLSLEALQQLIPVFNFVTQHPKELKTDEDEAE